MASTAPNPMNRRDNLGIVIGWTSSMHVCKCASGLYCVGNVVVAVLIMHAMSSLGSGAFTLSEDALTLSKV